MIDLHVATMYRQTDLSHSLETTKENLMGDIWTKNWSEGDYWERERSLESIRWAERKTEDDSQPHAMPGWS